MPDDISREGEKAPVIGQLGSNPVDHSHRAFPDAMHETGNPEKGIATEGNRIEPLV